MGCFQAGALAAKGSGFTPLTCTALCEGLNGTVAAVQGSVCFCPMQGRRQLVAKVRDNLCDVTCMSSYYSGIARQCGGAGQYYSVYQMYSFVHQTAQGCYDPWRFIWYQSVCVEVLTYDTSGKVVGYDMEWYLHASSINSGDALFPYHQPLDALHMGLQFDLDSSRILAYSLPTWGGKAPGDTWNPSLYMFDIRTLHDNILFTKVQVPFNFESDDISLFQFSTGISALDSMHDIYFMTMASVSPIPGFDDPRSYKTKLYGINLNTHEDILAGTMLEQSVVLLEVNSHSHELYALLAEEGTDANGTRQFFYVRLGRSYHSNVTTSAFDIIFSWTFGPPTVAHVVNPSTYQFFVDKVYQVGATAVDHLSNTSFVVMKTSAAADSPILIQDINQQGSNYTFDLVPLPVPQVQSTWLANTDPMIPLSLAAPKLQFARFSMDGRSILVHFDTSTIEGALPLDTNGDGLPDAIDWSTRQVGLRTCSDIFTRRSVALLGELPPATCQWQSSSTVQILVGDPSAAVGLGSGLLLKDATVYAFLPPDQWSTAASGGLAIGLPSPLVPPSVVVSYSSYVDLCAGTMLDAQESYNHGGRPKWVWSLQNVSCLGGLADTPELTEAVRELMRDASVGGQLQPSTGSQQLFFGAADLEAGCSYYIVLTVIGRWLLSSSLLLTVNKQAVPTPSVTIQNARRTTTSRDRALTLQALVSGTACDLLPSERRTLRFLWSGEMLVTNASTGAAVLMPIANLTALAPKTDSAAMLIPKYKLQPTIEYTFTITVGFMETWGIPGSTNTEQVAVTVERSAIKVGVLGGSRRVTKVDPLAIDATISLDPDFPDDLVEANPAWSFTYQCITPDGVPCFPVTTTTNNLTDLRDCNLTSETFQDANRSYALPAFSTQEGQSDTYYCRHPFKRGILLVNLQNPDALRPPSASASGNFAFTVTGSCYGRQAATSFSLEVLPGYETVLKVLMNALPVARVVTTDQLKVRGNLAGNDKKLYGNNVSWAWAFFRLEPNPLWTQQAATSAANAGQPYLVPSSTYIQAIELDAVHGQDFALTSLTSNNLVVRANTLRPSSVYAFRLIATAPDLLGDPRQRLLGYAELQIATAGAAPVPGTLSISPEGESYVTELKTLTAAGWTAEDTPLSYMFSYKADLTSNYSLPVNLRVNPISSPVQTAWCMRAGTATQSYAVRAFVTVYSLYGASTTLGQDYRVLPPADPAAARARILKQAQDVGPESSSQVLSCYQMPVAPGLSPLGAPAPAPRTAEQQAAVEAEANSLLRVLKAQAANAVVTPSSVAGNLQAASDIASSGAVTDEMLQFVGGLTDQAAQLILEVGSENTRDSIALQSFATLGTLGLASAAISSGGTVNENSRMNAQNSISVFSTVRSGGSSGASAARRLDEDMDEELEAVEQEWLSYVSDAEAAAQALQRQRQNEEAFLANYSANLGPEERQVVLLSWAEDKARVQAATQTVLQSRSNQTKQMMGQIGKVCAAVLSFMLNTEKKDFNFPLGAIRFGRARDLTIADSAFAIGDPSWAIPYDVDGSYGWQNVKFTQVNPLKWAPSAPPGPFMISALDLYDTALQRVEVQHQSVPITVMADAGSFAAGQCQYWDWEANGGLGDWSRKGLLNGEQGCSSTHLSVIGMFLDATLPVVQQLRAVEGMLGDEVVEINTFVSIGVAVAMAVNVLLHYLGFKQDRVDHTKPLEMKKLGDGIKGPRSQEDPVHYSPSAAAQSFLTFWNLARRDHLLVSCFCRCERLKVTRIQKASVLFAAVSGSAAVSALLCGERVVDPRHYIEVGVISATLTYPLVGVLAMLFASRPISDGAAAHDGAGDGEFCGPLEAMPVPDDEHDESLGPVEGAAGPAAPPPPTTPPRWGDPAPEAGGGLPVASPAWPPAPGPGLHVPVPQGPGVPLPPPPPSSGGPRASTEGGVPPPPRQPALPLLGAGGAFPRPPPSKAGSSTDGLAPAPRLPGEPEEFAMAGMLPVAASAPPGGAPPAATALPQPEESGTSQMVLSRTRSQLMRRLRRMYVERALQESEKVAYDERIDMKSNVPHPMARLANVIAHMAVALYWILACVITFDYALYFAPNTAVQWAFACLSAWLFTFLVLELVKVALAAILELSQLSQRKRLCDHSKFKERVRMNTERKIKKMKEKERSGALAPGFSALLPQVHSGGRPPLPAESPPPTRGRPREAPALGDASAG